MANKQRRGGRATPPDRRRTPHPAGGAGRSSAPTSDRYTPRKPAFRLRPSWHRVAGWVGILLGVAVVAANDLMLIRGDLTLLPGGHTELYLFIGIAISAASTWFLGLFDRGTTIYG
jgi:hypothetical protein